MTTQSGELMHLETQCGDGNATPPALSRRLDKEWVNYELLMHMQIKPNAWAVLLLDHNKRYFSGVISPGATMGLWITTRNAHMALSHYMGISSEPLHKNSTQDT